MAPLAFVLPLLIAAALGFALAYDIELTLLAVGTLALGAVMLVRLELAALLVVGASVFEDYLALLNPSMTKALAVLLVAAWVIRRGWRRLHDGDRSPVLVVAAVFLGVVLLAFLVNDNAGAGVTVVLRYAGFAAVLAVLADTMRSGLSPARVAGVYVAACTVAAVFGIAVFVLGLDRRVGGPVGDPNDFAFFMIAAIPLALALRRGAARPRVHDLVVCLLLLATLGTLSRGALLGLLVAIVVAAIARMITVRQLLLGAVLTATLAALSAGVFSNLVSVSIEQKAAVGAANVDERVELWRAASAMTVDHPLLGRGPGAFAVYHRDYRDDQVEITEPLDVAHNTYLEISAELGVIGLLAWLALLATAIGAAWLRWRRDREPLAAGVMSALVATGVAAFFVTEQYFLPLWLLMALAAALLQPAPSTATLLRPRVR